MKIVILDRATLGSDISLLGLQELGESVVYDMTRYDETLSRIKDADVVITNKVVIDADIIKNAPSLKLICVAATGMNNIDLQVASEMGIMVKNVAGYSTQSVVQHTFSLLFYLVSHLRFYDEYVRSGKWEESELFTSLDRPFWELSGKKWGIIGLGAIGKEVAKIATTFGCEVRYYSTSGNNDNEEYTRLDLDWLLLSSDIISIHTPLNKNTKNLFDYSKLKLIKEGSVLINVGRGGIIDEGDLAKVIDEKEIYVGLDVLENEPIKQYSPLNHVVKRDRLFITPHIAWSSKEARMRLLDGVIQNIKNFYGI